MIKEHKPMMFACQKSPVSIILHNPLDSYDFHQISLALWLSTEIKKTVKDFWHNLPIITSRATCFNVLLTTDYRSQSGRLLQNPMWVIHCDSNRVSAYSIWIQLLAYMYHKIPENLCAPDLTLSGSPSFIC